TGVQRTHKINLENNETTKEEYKLKLGDEIAQGIYLQLAKIGERLPVDSFEELEESTQGDQGFGSTDRRKATRKKTTVKILEFNPLSSPQLNCTQFLETKWIYKNYESQPLILIECHPRYTHPH
ncbi:8602_t:CDS:2, partial [Ambispora leptoticha]